MRSIIVLVITLGFMAIVDQSFGVLRKFFAARPYVAPERYLDEDLTRDYLDRIDYARLNAIPDRYAELRKLEGQTVNLANFKTNIALTLSNCPGRNHSTVTLEPSGKTLFDVDQNYDEHCRRITVPSNFHAKKFVLAFGDSFTFGQGLDDGGTYPSQLASRWPEVSVYNLGICGSGPNRLLYQFQNDPNRLDGITQSEGIAVYYFIGSHVSRVMCPAGCLNEKSYILPQAWYSLGPDSRLQFHGTFYDRTMMNFLLWPIAHSQIRQFLGLDFPREGRADYELFVALLKGLRDEISKKNSLREFVFVFGDGSSIEQRNVLSPLLRAEKFRVLDYVSIDTSRVLGESGFLPVDGHPTARYNSVLADWLKSDLAPLFSDQVTKGDGDRSFSTVGRAF